MEAYLIVNAQGEMLLWTARHREADCVVALCKLKRREWPELRAEGYRTVRVTVAVASLSVCDCGAVDEDTLAPHADDCPCRPDDTHTLVEPPAVCGDCEYLHVCKEDPQRPDYCPGRVLRT